MALVITFNLECGIVSDKIEIGSDTWYPKPDTCFPMAGVVCGNAASGVLSVRADFYLIIQYPTSLPITNYTPLQEALPRASNLLLVPRM